MGQPNFPLFVADRSRDKVSIERVRIVKEYPWGDDARKKQPFIEPVILETNGIEITINKTLVLQSVKTNDETDLRRLYMDMRTGQFCFLIIIDGA